MTNDALKNEFLLESFENLSSIDNQITQLEKDPKNKELLNAVYRTVHTMKGSSSFLGLKLLQEVTHNAENLLDKIREDEIDLTHYRVDVLLKSFDICNFILKNIEKNGEEGEVDIDPIKRLLIKAMTEDHSPDEVTKVDEPGHDMTDEEETTQELSPSSDGLDDLIELHKSSDGQMIGDANPPSDTPYGAEAEAAGASSGDDGEINEAALESLRELAASGDFDPELLKELEGGANSSTPDESLKTEKLVEVVAEEDVVKTKEKEPEEVPIQTKAKEEKISTGNDKKSIVDSVIRVNVSVLDRIMNIVGELVLNRNQFVQKSSKVSDTEIARLSHQLNIITSELQSEVMSTRMQPIGNILTKFERLVRDFSRESGKNINLKLSGQDTELDRTLIEAIKDPLVHIIRNSADHGLESVDERKSSGKDPQGTIHIKAYNESGQVTVEISDDGRGIDSQKILNKAIEKNVVNKENAANLTEHQILNLIFAPGFSTAEQVTNISGRGVGMDVVKTNIEKIGGTVQLKSTLGKGTTFKLRIPLTLAIVPAIIVKSSGETFAIPQLNLDELVRLEGEKEMKSVETIQGTKFVRLRGNLTPLFDLRDCLGLTNVNDQTSMINSVVENIGHKSSDEATKFDDDSLNIAILNAENNVYGIIVDEILDTEEIVVKPLNNSLKEIGVFGGATIMGDGKVSLIVDAVGFLNMFSDLKDSSTRTDIMKKMMQDEYSLDTNLEAHENILFRLEDNRTYALPLALVSRLEEINYSKIEFTGAQPVIKYLDKPMPLIDLENVLKLDGQSVLHDNSSEKLQCVVVSLRGYNFALVVSEILDISINRANLETTSVDRAGLLGTIFIDDKIVTILDLFKILELLNFNFVDINEMDGINTREFKVLVVDDSLVYRKLEGDTLEGAGFPVLFAENGEEGLKVLKENPDISLIITDIEMPVMDGFKFITSVKENDNLKNIPVIAVSTRVSVEDKEKGIQAGFDYHLEKFNREEVLNIVKEVIK